VLALLLASVPGAASADDVSDVSGSPARLIIGFRAGALAETAGRGTPAGTTDRANRLAEGTGREVRALRDLGGRMVGIRLAEALAPGDVAGTLAAWRANPDVEFAEIDQRRQIRAVPGDPLYASQWYLQGTEVAGSRLEAAWDTTTGSPDVVVAVLDTGVRFEHPDLAARLVAGYDFVSGESASSFVSANDGNDWDADASDPGDWVSSTEAESGPLAGCDESSSSWHGTRVAGMIGAATANGTGIAGATWASTVLPVRVLGKCGGYDSDIIAGMRWAAGLPVSGAPANPHPARVLNLSLGGSGRCNAAYRNAIAELSAAGVVVIASAGNDSGPVDTPANCAGVLAVTGLRHVGTKVGYSSFGSTAGIAAPAGNCPDPDSTLCAYKLVTTDNSGTTVPQASTYTDAPADCNFPVPFFFCNVGTSFSAPIVSSIAALMLGVNDALDAPELIERLKASARHFPVDPAIPTCPTLDGDTGQCNCTTTTCGAGIADAPGAVAGALRPIARILKPDDAAAGELVVLDGTGSAAADGRTLAAFAWSVVAGVPTSIGPTSGDTLQVGIPESGGLTVRLQVTDDLGRTDSRDLVLSEATGGGGGGGGALDLASLLAILLASARQRYPSAWSRKSRA